MATLAVGRAHLTGQWARITGAVVAGLLALFLALAAGTAVAAPGSQTPLLTAAGPLRGADPSVMQVASGPDAGWYIYTTGSGDQIEVSRSPAVAGPYGHQAAALKAQGWFGSRAELAPDLSHDMWAPAVSEIGGRFVMYFAAWNATRGERCIGVATALHPLGPFTLAAGTIPICAPRTANYGGVEAEAIDPSFFTSATGQRYLVFKAGTADRHNVAIWAYPMTADGQRPEGTPRVILHTKGAQLQNAIENPDLIQYDGELYLFVSGNYYGNCFYETDVYRAASLTSFSKTAAPTQLLTLANTGLCGPGGASVTPDGSTIVYHAWAIGKASAETFTAVPGTARVLYTAHLTWGATGPGVG